jgi:uncharacterized tellurite resistance protein B-like protein
MAVRHLLDALGLGGGEAPPSEHKFLARVHRELGKSGRGRLEYLAAFAGQLARVALADAELSKTEEVSILRLLRERAHLSRDEAKLVVDLIHHEAETLKGLQNHLLNRAVNEHATRKEKEELVDCLYAVAAADASISNVEDREVRRVAGALMIPQKTFAAIRSRYGDCLEVMRLVRRGG